jgi:hypothetical protein
MRRIEHSPKHVACRQVFCRGVGPYGAGPFAPLPANALLASSGRAADFAEASGPEGCTGPVERGSASVKSATPLTYSLRRDDSDFVVFLLW